MRWSFSVPSLICVLPWRSWKLLCYVLQLSQCVSCLAVSLSVHQSISFTTLNDIVRAIDLHHVTKFTLLNVNTVSKTVDLCHLLNLVEQQLAVTYCRRMIWIHTWRTELRPFSHLQCKWQYPSELSLGSCCFHCWRTRYLDDTHTKRQVAHLLFTNDQQLYYQNSIKNAAAGSERASDWRPASATSVNDSLAARQWQPIASGTEMIRFGYCTELGIYMTPAALWPSMELISSSLRRPVWPSKRYEITYQ